MSIEGRLGREAVGAEFDAEERFGKFMRLGAGGLMEGGTGLDPEAAEPYTGAWEECVGGGERETSRSLP